ncbi:hypothetical protein KC331_g10504 [Hortaea werneckii]|nr:hypothetical protein KC334_g3793 [Hortaea werneckii]KAI7002535.1 hypothetical protein KC355_g9752 [Hortaea werneckii]KAI7538182.1 hypothetical protein KC331_g10504 [Hortaea werneckii]KAI7716431.1 hypothetical protein KC353_g5391 [Hortaea werneckii]
MATEERPYKPSLPWRITSAIEIGVVGFLSRSFLYALNRTETYGIDNLLEILDRRSDESKRTRGLITVSNHVSVLDDPLTWGVLPYKYHWDPNNMRWALGSYDICFRNKMFEAFFSYGNTLPTHRKAYSQYGGIFQPTINQAIRLLSDPHANLAPEKSSRPADPPTLPTSLPPSDPFSAAQLTYSTNGADAFPSPSAYPFRRYGWVHIFPEGMIHQHPDKLMRYFKWGVARLILEAEPCPDVLPMWIDGPQQVMDNNRGWPRPLPRIGKDVSVAFGSPVDTEQVFGPFRQRWQELKDRARRKRMLYYPTEDPAADPEKEVLGELNDDELKYGQEAEQLRIEVTLAVRNEVLKVRRSRGLPDEDPKRGLAETFAAERGNPSRNGRRMGDGSVVQIE